MLNHRLCFIISFNKNVLWLLTLLCLGCGNVPSGGTNSSSSQSACAGDGGLFPTPVGPQSVREWQKFTVRESFSHLSPGTPLVAVVDETCLMAQPAGSQALSQSLRAEVEAQPSLLRSRAYALSPAISYSIAELKKLTLADPCLLHLGEDAEVFKDTTTVNDAQFPLQTHLNTIEAPAAWDTFYSGISGDVVIAIIDDGIELTHSDFSGALWTNPGEIAGNSIDDDGNGYVDDVNGYNFATGIGSPAHEAGSSHGTHVAGLAAAKDNNSIGVTGVMGRNAKIMALNVFGAGASAGTAPIVNALNYARAMGAKVINMSLGGQGS
ncbi:MAG: S8 family serine peptidase, partial [Bdellovibrionales bacterium]|nr:S8 family serine peptidase [Bdellovibrionales bacterium]